MKKFLVLYMAPAAGMAEWMKRPAEERKAEEDKMQSDWKEWTTAHASMFADIGGGAGKATRIAATGASDASNDVMLYATVQADSREAAAAAFADHPHLQIPDAWIEIMEIRPMGM